MTTTPTPDHGTSLTFRELEPEPPPIGPPCPQWCPDGPTSHVWTFYYDGDCGGGLSTSQCPICERGANGEGTNDWPHVFLTIELPVRLEPHTETYGYYDVEYDHWVYMNPVEAST